MLHSPNRSGLSDLTGIREQGKYTTGTYGNLGEPPASTRNFPVTDNRVITSPGSTGKELPPSTALRKEQPRKVVSKSRETEDDEMGEGSHSLFMVPFERWEISSVKATK